MGERFASEGMRVVLADVEAPVLDKTVAECAERGLDVIGVETDVTDLGSVEALAARAYDEFGAVHVLCNNAGVGAGAEGRMWEHTTKDWQWAIDVNVWGVLNGLRAFVPRMLEAAEPGHIVNTTSGNGGISPLASTPIYAMTKAAVVTITEVLYAQLADDEADIGVSLLYPGPKMLRTGLFESWRNRPDDMQNEQPRKTPPTTLASFEKRMTDAGAKLDYTPVEDIAAEVVEAIHANRFWILPESKRTDATIRARSTSMLERSNPEYLRDVTG